MVELGSLIASALFPRSCVRCGREGTLCCVSCRRERPLTPPEATVDHVAAFAYGNPLVRDLLRSWKYDFDFSAWHTLRQAAEGVLPRINHLLGNGNTLIVPIPLSHHRYRERGFNQSTIIADWLGLKLNLLVANILDRKHSTIHQAQLNTEQRLSLGLTAPFILRQCDSGIWAGVDTVLLVDDVFTTGSTIAAARTVLLDSHDKRIVSFTLAKS